MFHKIYPYVSLIFFLVIPPSCKTTTNTNNSDVCIYTEFGTMYVKLYDDTPIHKTNFLSLTNKHFFDNLLFHRVIPSFMIQGGDPDSRNASSGTLLGNGGPNYTLEAEILPSHFHKRGAIAAAREGDATNPYRRSSGSQFYIVTGRTYTDEELDKIENYIQQQTFYTLYLQYLDKLKKQEQKTNQNLDMALLSVFAQDSARKVLSHQPPFKFTSEQRNIYKTIGGAPHLDNSYTVFGEVVQGMDVADRISRLERDKNDRPFHDITMKISPVKK